jgi:hypothetical protein
MDGSGFLSLFSTETPAPQKTLPKNDAPEATELDEYKADAVFTDEEAGSEESGLMHANFTTVDEVAEGEEVAATEESIPLGFKGPDEDDPDSKFPIERTKIYLFIMADFHWTMLVLFAHLCFWKYGMFDAFSLYGYKDYIDEGEDYAAGGYRIYEGGSLKYYKTCELKDGCLNTNDDGRLLSGPSGSGVFVISFLLMLLGSFIWVSRYYAYDAQKEHPEIEVLPLRSFFVLHYVQSRYL